MVRLESTTLYSPSTDCITSASFTRNLLRVACPSGEKYLRHGDDHKVQPVPWVSEECKAIYTESSCRDFYERLKCINSCEGVPERQGKRHIGKQQQYSSANTCKASSGARPEAQSSTIIIVREKKERCTYSTCFDHSGGSLKVMNIQLVKIVHMMIMLKRVSGRSRGQNGN